MYAFSNILNIIAIMCITVKDTNCNVKRYYYKYRVKSYTMNVAFNDI